MVCSSYSLLLHRGRGRRVGGQSGGVPIGIRRVGGLERRIAIRPRLVAGGGLGASAPGLELVGRDRLHLDRHEGMIDAADLVALAVEGARAVDLDPALVV